MANVDQIRLSIARAVVAVAAFALAACGDEAPRSGPHDKAASAIDSGPHQAKWLELSSPLSPAQWLASHGEPKVRTLDDPEVRRLDELLNRANARYRESERMIANRAVQLSDMLKPLGIQETPTAILVDLVGIAGEVGQTEGFGAVSQHYFNLRASSIARPDALTTLKARYSARS
jgi:hypothetical protein